MKAKKSVLEFLKAQLSAFLGGITDYLLMIILTEMGHLHYTFSIVISGITGAIVNFSLNKSWTFKSAQSYHSALRSQVVKFSVVAGGSIVLKVSGTYFITKTMNIDYRISRLLIDSFVSYGFNYPLIKLWVFKKKQLVIIN